jgi:hypothetical protein
VGDTRTVDNYFGKVYRLTPMNETPKEREGVMTLRLSQESLFKVEDSIFEFHRVMNRNNPLGASPEELVRHAISFVLPSTNPEQIHVEQYESLLGYASALTENRRRYVATH